MRYQQRCNVFMPSDATFDVSACLEGVRRHDAESARTLVQHLYPLVIKIVRSYRSRRLAEEDLAQEIFLKMFTRLDQYHGRNGVPFEHWLSRIAVTTCLDGLRAEKRRPEYRWADLSDGEREWVEFWAAKESVPVPTDTIGAREAVEKLLTQLSPEDRLIITLLDLQERSIAEIATLTGWGISRIKVRAFRARQKLRSHARKMQKESKL